MADDRLLRARSAAQGLTDRSVTSPEQVVSHLLAVQAQDPRGARLAVRARSSGLTAADVDAAFTRRRSLVVCWSLRGTLHMVAADDHWWIHDLTAERHRTGSRRRLAEEGVDPDAARRGIDVVAAAVAEGPCTRSAVRALLGAAGVPVGGPAVYHVLFAAAIEGVVVRGPVVDGEQAFVDPGVWLGRRPEPLEEEQALARLARRYLAAHGPASAADLARWSGLPIGMARRGLAGTEEETVRWDDDHFVLARDADGSASTPPPRLLGPFDPMLLGWSSREPVVGAHGDAVVAGGLLRSTATVDGRVAGTWRLDAGQVVLSPLDPIGPTAMADLGAEAVDVGRFLGRAVEGLVVEG